MVCSFLLDTQQYGRFLFGGGLVGCSQPSKKRKKDNVPQEEKKGGRKIRKK